MKNMKETMTVKMMPENMEVRIDVVEKMIELTDGYIHLGLEENFVNYYLKDFNFEEQGTTKEKFITELKISNKLIQEKVIKELDAVYEEFEKHKQSSGYIN